jgi:hypothetical protein
MLTIAFVVALVAAQQDGAPAPTAPTAPAKSTAESRKAAREAALDKVECRKVTPTGTSVSGTACFTVREWSRISRESREAGRVFNDMTRDASGRR